MPLAQETQSFRYGEAPNAVMDVYPTKNEKSPIVAFVHGGGWSSGSRKWVQIKPRFFNQLGYTFVSIGYPYLPEANVEQQISAIERAIKWLKLNAGKFSGDADSLTLSGHSSGAHLAVVTALKLGPRYVQNVIAIDSPMYDLRPLLTMPRRGVTTFFKRIFGQSEAELKQKSAHQFIENHKTYASYLFAYSNQNFDGWIINNVENFANDLRRSGAADVTIFRGLDYDHLGLHRKIGEENDRFTEAIRDFLQSRTTLE